MLDYDAAVGTHTQREGEERGKRERDDLVATDRHSCGGFVFHSDTCPAARECACPCAARCSKQQRQRIVSAVIAAVCSRQTLAHTHTHTHTAPDCRAADAVAVAVPQKNIV